MANCVICQAELEAGNSFCLYCGARHCGGCGAALVPGDTFCVICGQQSGIPVRVPPPQVQQPERPAGFWRRLVALAVDTLIFWGFLYLLNLAIGAWMSYSIESTVYDPAGPALRDTLDRFQWIKAIASIGVMWLYFAGLEASPLQGTLGKRFLKVRLTDSTGGRIALWRSTIRFAMKPLSAAPCLFGYIIAGWNSRRRGLHDMISGVYPVVRAK